jgi:hypothetical protein
VIQIWEEERSSHPSGQRRQTRCCTIGTDLVFGCFFSKGRGRARGSQQGSQRGRAHQLSPHARTHCPSDRPQCRVSPNTRLRNTAQREERPCGSQIHRCLYLLPNEKRSCILIYSSPSSPCYQTPKPRKFQIRNSFSTSLASPLPPGPRLTGTLSSMLRNSPTRQTAPPRLRSPRTEPRHQVSLESPRHSLLLARHHG